MEEVKVLVVLECPPQPLVVEGVMKGGLPQIDQLVPPALLGREILAGDGKGGTAKLVEEVTLKGN